MRQWVSSIYKWWCVSGGCLPFKHRLNITQTRTAESHLNVFGEFIRQSGCRCSVCALHSQKHVYTTRAECCRLFAIAKLRKSVVAYYLLWPRYGRAGTALVRGGWNWPNSRANETDGVSTYTTKLISVTQSLHVRIVLLAIIYLGRMDGAKETGMWFYSYVYGSTPNGVIYVTHTTHTHSSCIQMHANIQCIQHLKCILFMCKYSVEWNRIRIFFSPSVRVCVCAAFSMFLLSTLFNKKPSKHTTLRDPSTQGVDVENCDIKTI